MRRYLEPHHSQESVARRAGLPGCIVHGTALWALARVTLASAYGDGDTRRLSALEGRFSAMVAASTPITVHHSRLKGREGAVAFTVRNVQGRNAISDGLAVFSQH